MASYDPLDYYARLLRNPYAGLIPAEKKEPSITSVPLPDQEADSLLGDLARKGAGGLAWAGEAISKPGRMVRGLTSGLTGGKWGGGLLNLIPFSDSLGITDPEDSVWGRDLLEHFGAIGPNQEGFDWGDVAGLATDIGTDPLTFMSFGSTGAATAAGRAAAKLGVMPKGARAGIAGYKNLAEVPAHGLDAAIQLHGGVMPATKHLMETVVDKPLRGIVNVGLPFTEGTVLGAGRSGEKFLDALDVAKSWATAGKYNPLEPVLGHAARYGRALFDPESKGMWSQPGQDIARAQFPAEQRALAEMNRKFADTYYKMKEAGFISTDVGATKAWSEKLRDLMENVAAHPLTQEEMLLKGMGDDLVGYTNKWRDLRRAAGHDMEDMTGVVNARTGDPLGYFMRHSLKPEAKTLEEAWQQAAGGSGPAFNMHPAALSARDEGLRLLDTRTANQLLADAELTKPLGQGAFATEVQRLHELGQRLPAIAQERDKLKAVMQSLAGRQPGEVFGRHVLEDFEDTARALIRGSFADDAVHQMLGGSLKGTGTPGAERFIPLSENLLRNKLGFGEQHWQDAAKSIFGKSGAFNPAHGPALPLPALDELADWAVDPRMVEDALRRVQGFSVPTAVRPLVAAGDWFTNLFKSLQTNIWPGFHTRNLLSGQVANVADDVFSPRSLTAANDLMRGRPVGNLADHPWFQGLTPEQATQELQKLIYTHSVPQHGVREVVGNTAGGQQLAERFVGEVPFQGFLNEAKAGLTDLVTNPVPGSRNPFAVRGVAGYDQSRFAPLVHGENVAEGVEHLNRLPAFLEAGWKGYAPAEAAALSKAAHVDYQHLTDFEKHALRRLIPFYSWQRGMLPKVAGDMLTNPGGLYGQSARAAASLRSDPSQFIPEYLGGGLAVPVGEEKDGTQQFLTKLDLNAAEAVFEPLKPTLDRTAMGLLGMMNPLVKGPLEWATGKQFFSGRDLADLHTWMPNSTTGQIVANSPASRLASTIGQVLDPRKYENVWTLPVNLATGARFSDVDMQKQRNIAARDALIEASRGDPLLRIMDLLYARKEDLPKLGPDEIEKLRLSATLQKRAREAKKAEEAKK